MQLIPPAKKALRQYLNGKKGGRPKPNENPKITQTKPTENPKITQTEPTENPKITQTKPTENPKITQTEPTENPKITHSISNLNNNLNTTKEEDREEKEEEENIRAREEFSSSSSSSENFVLGDFDKLCDEMLSANGTFPAKVRTMNPKYNVPNEKFDGWVEIFRTYKHSVCEDGLKSRNDVRRNFISWLPKQINAEESEKRENAQPADITFTEEQSELISSHCNPVTLSQAKQDLIKYCTKTKQSPEKAVNDFAAARDNGWSYFEIQGRISRGELMPITPKKR